ncbi:hypothetical protein N483_17775 [Pseudoalteromonas luteoviolacea NCIMB 1944]|nr:hypothetical protein N483_17775 [Pseudoalteromonas luteoviolacea NCIMB 1944]
MIAEKAVHLFILLILIASIYLYIVYLNRSNKPTDDRSVTELFSIEPGSVDVVKIDKVFITDPQAEYIYHAEIDTNAVNRDGIGELYKARYFAQVSVSFEDDFREVALHRLEYNQENEFYAEDESVLKSFYPLSPSALIEQAASSGPWLLYVDDDWFIELHINLDVNNVYFIYTEINGERCTSIKVWAEGDFLTIGDMHSKLNQLIRKYEDMPYQHFKGAVRV